MLFSIRKIGQQFIQGGILDWFYIGLILLLTGLIIVVSVFTLVFLLHTFDTVIFASDEEITSEVSSFNIPGLKILGPRFGIVINDITAPLAQPQYKKEAPLPVSTVFISPPPFSELKLRILNGTGIPGLAGTWKKRFEAKGLREITIGNTLEQDQKGVVIMYKPGKEIFLKAVHEILEQQGNVTVHENEDSSLSDDIVIVIGK